MEQSLVDQLKEMMAEREKDLVNKKSFRDLKEFYQEMLEKGVAIKKPYQLPQLDTVGRTVGKVLNSQFKTTPE